MLEQECQNNCKEILKENYKITDKNKVLIIYDDEYDLTKILKKGYEGALEELGIDFESIDFFKHDNEFVNEKINELNPTDLVILLQSSSFRMSKYRWRNLLFEKDLKVIEHPHLQKNTYEQFETYINSISSDLDYYRKVSNFLREKLSNSNSLKIISHNGKILEFSGSFDDVYENIAYFEDKKNWGTRFPVGEVLTESLNLEDLNGEMELYAFPDKRQLMHFCNKPFLCKVKDGFLSEHEGPKEFKEIVDMIKTENEDNLVYIRELGLGLNRNISVEKSLNDVCSFERLEGVHLSLGMKHGIYQKKLWPKYGKKFYQRYHIDVFLDVKEILVNKEKIYDKEKGYLF